MKKTTFIVLCFIGGILNSCTKELKTFDLNIAVQSSFDGDKVQVLIDYEELINKQFQTNYSLGLSGGVVTTRDKGRHEIKVVVNNASGKAENFTLDSDLYVGVNYDRQTNAVSFIFSKQPFAYD
jgi:hypothetical protein